MLSEILSRLHLLSLIGFRFAALVASDVNNSMVYDRILAFGLGNPYFYRHRPGGSVSDWSTLTTEKLTSEDLFDKVAGGGLI